MTQESCGRRPSCRWMLLVSLLIVPVLGLAQTDPVPTETAGTPGTLPPVSVLTREAKNEDELLFIRENGKFGFIDRTGKPVIPCIYENTYGFTEGMAGVRLKGRIGYLDRTGKMVIPVQFEDGYAFFEGLAWVKIEGKYAWINRQGKVVIAPASYEEVATGFSDGLTAVKQNGRWGYIDRQGQMVIRPQYVKATKFREGIAQTVLPGDPGKYAWIDRTGKIIWQEP
ncbi:MAG: WG repeat-containing protein [Blastocatellia bacterium]